MATVTHTDTRIRDDVEAELAFDPRIASTEIGVRVVDGVVTLFGAVDSYMTRLTAEACAHRVRGVTAVANELEVRLPTLHTRTDEDIARAAATVLKWNVRVPDEQVDVTVTDGRVTLKGEVDWNYQRLAAERAVRALMGVTGVTNFLTVRRRVAPSDVKHRIQEALIRQATLDGKQVGVDVKGSTVTLHGRVRSFAERQEAQRAAWSVAGVTAVDNDLVIQ